MSHPSEKLGPNGSIFTNDKSNGEPITEKMLAKAAAPNLQQLIPYNETNSNNGVSRDSFNFGDSQSHNVFEFSDDTLAIIFEKNINNSTINAQCVIGISNIDASNFSIPVNDSKKTLRFAFDGGKISFDNITNSIKQLLSTNPNFLPESLKKNLSFSIYQSRGSSTLITNDNEKQLINLLYSISFNLGDKKDNINNLTKLINDIPSPSNQLLKELQTNTEINKVFNDTFKITSTGLLGRKTQKGSGTIEIPSSWMSAFSSKGGKKNKTAKIYK